MNQDQNREILKQKLLTSTAVRSLDLETEIFDCFQRLGWSAKHSPYYVDADSKKFREVDVTARKRYESKTNDLACTINFIIECKTIKDYHIIVSNRFDDPIKSKDLISSWIGEDSYNDYRKIKEILRKAGLGAAKQSVLLKEIEKYCFPKNFIRHIDYRLDAFELPVYNSFRETNIGTTKELENSVIWKSFQSLLSCVNFYDEMVWDGFESLQTELQDRNDLTEEKIAKSLRSTFFYKANQVSYVHPVIVVESQLWEKDSEAMNELKYFRLVFQRIFDLEIWVDVVNREHLNEYFNKTKEYGAFFESKNFKALY